MYSTSLCIGFPAGVQQRKALKTQPRCMCSTAPFITHATPTENIPEASELDLAPPTGNKEKYGWPARLISLYAL